MSRKRQRSDFQPSTKEQETANIIKVLSPLSEALSEITGDQLRSNWAKGDKIYRKIREIEFYKEEKGRLMRERKICELGHIVYDASRPVSGGKRRRKKRTKKRRKLRRRKRTKKRRKSRRRKRR